MSSLRFTSHTPNILKENLNRCSLNSALTFNSNRLRNFKENILSEISSKLETFNESGEKTERVSDNTAAVITSSSSSSSSSSSTMCRKPKIRSVYGQPEVMASNCEESAATSANNLQNCHHSRSFDSLEASDSGLGLASNSTSCSDLRLSCSASKRPMNNSVTSTDTVVSDLGTSVESSDNELEPYHNRRCHSSNSTSSGCSLESREDESTREAKYFMKNFVRSIFANSALISLEEKAKFGKYARLESGRVWFARYITKERNENKRVAESTFYSLAQYFAIILFECSEVDHFTPAKSLMNMCFTYYYQPISRNMLTNTGEKQFLYVVLRDQPIWRSLRFWNAVFFEGVQTERMVFFEKRRSSTDRGSEQDVFNDWQFQANVTFGQLGTLTYNMYSFGLPKPLCLEFVHKQSTIANLTKEQVFLLEQNIETLFGACETN